ncbi:MAG: ATP-dependent Clp protease ATP-binding subunit ClpC [Planctomycetota bacterium]
MTGTAQERSVYRYFDLADCFVQIVALEEAGLNLAERPGLGRAGYRKMVIEACMPEFRTDLDDRLDQLFPDDPLMVEDLLYQLCVEVNPALDIHEVRLTVDSSVRKETPTTATQDAALLERDAALERLRMKARTLEAHLRRHIIGQDQAVTAVSRAIRSAAAGLGESHRPLASFLFTGRTGTGKTELARCLASHAFKSPQHPGLVRIDCSEFGMAHEYSKLIGSPPGYIGHDDGGQLTDAVAEAPESVVLFDEIEKAHPKLHNLMLQILEEGALTDGKGRRVSFARTTVIMTSNCGADDVTSASRAVGFGGVPTLGRATLGRATLQDITGQALAATFSPEFLGRIGETVLFDELGKKSVERIAGIKLSELQERASTRGMDVRFTASVASWIAERGFKPESGARELRRVIQKELEPELSERLLSGGPAGRRTLVVRTSKGRLVFEG